MVAGIYRDLVSWCQGKNRAQGHDREGEDEIDRMACHPFYNPCKQEKINLQHYAKTLH